MTCTLEWIAIVVATVLAFLIISVVIDHYGNMVGWSLVLPIWRARRRVRRLLKPTYPDVRVSSLGASAIDPIYFCILIDVETDSQKQEILSDDALNKQMRDVIAKSGYPAEAIPHIGFSVESQQTVTRDFAGNWFHARK